MDVRSVNVSFKKRLTKKLEVFISSQISFGRFSRVLCIREGIITVRRPHYGCGAKADFRSIYFRVALLETGKIVGDMRKLPIEEVLF